MNCKTRNLFILSLSAVSVFAVAQMANAATATNTFLSTVTIEASCDVLSTNTLDFGTQGILTANVDTTATFQVQCTNGTTYDVGLNEGSTTGGTTATRLMTDGNVPAATVAYEMFSASTRNPADNWGDAVGSDTVAGTGNGAAQTLTVYGRVPAQTTPAPGTYNDTVTVTITY